MRILNHFKRCLRRELEGGTGTQQPRAGATRARADGLGHRERSDFQNKIFWSVRGLLRDGFNVTLTLSVISKEDPSLGQQKDLGLKPAVLLTSWVSLGKFPGLSDFQFTHKTIQKDKTIGMKCLHTAWHRVGIHHCNKDQQSIGAVVDGCSGGPISHPPGVPAFLRLSPLECG